jgi:cbb3-type cytochrome oxidase cytochrome c subunit
VKWWPGILGLILLGSCSAAPALGPAGADLARRLGCFACHSHQGQGGTIAAPLDGIGARLSRESLAIMLTYPRRLHPGAKMPSYAYVPLEERRALEKFLSALK